MKRGIWPFRSTWYSICSKHRDHKPSCDLCSTGTWRNDIISAFSSLVYKKKPDLWRWWMNLKPIKARWLESFRQIK